MSIFHGDDFKERPTPPAWERTVINAIAAVLVTVGLAVGIAVVLHGF